ncbi:MAG: hypothetical protein U5L96_04025 [Owenweeksia sp.]|nr:hypothetical protein [Owenweeksia sp.]
MKGLELEILLICNRYQKAYLQITQNATPFPAGFFIAKMELSKFLNGDDDIGAMQGWVAPFTIDENVMHFDIDTSEGIFHVELLKPKQDDYLFLGMATCR